MTWVHERSLFEAHVNPFTALCTVPSSFCNGEQFRWQKKPFSWMQPWLNYILQNSFHSLISSNYAPNELRPNIILLGILHKSYIEIQHCFLEVSYLVATVLSVDFYLCSLTAPPRGAPPKPKLNRCFSNRFN